MHVGRVPQSPPVHRRPDVELAALKVRAHAGAHAAAAAHAAAVVVVVVVVADNMLTATARPPRTHGVFDAEPVQHALELLEPI